MMDSTHRASLIDSAGFVDGHVHPIWSGDRVHEFSMKLAGASYMEIHKQKGGIHYTVECTRDESDAKLAELLVNRLTLMRNCGTTAAECKTGFVLLYREKINSLDHAKYALENFSS